MWTNAQDFGAWLNDVKLAYLDREKLGRYPAMAGAINGLVDWAITQFAIDQHADAEAQHADPLSHPSCSCAVPHD